MRAGMQNSSFPSIDTVLLVGVTGGTGPNLAAWEKFKKQASSAPFYGKKIAAILNENGGAPPATIEEAQALGERVKSVLPEIARGLADKQMGPALAELFPGQQAGATAVA
jgi:hypothetical protein